MTTLQKGNDYATIDTKKVAVVTARGRERPAFRVAAFIHGQTNETGIGYYPKPVGKEYAPDSGSDLYELAKQDAISRGWQEVEIEVMLQSRNKKNDTADNLKDTHSYCVWVRVDTVDSFHGIDSMEREFTLDQHEKAKEYAERLALQFKEVSYTPY